MDNIISVISLVISILVAIRAWRWKNEADWFLTYFPENQPVKWQALDFIDKQPPTHVVELSNIGDGTAYDVRVFGIHCRTALLNIEGKTIVHREELPRIGTEQAAYVAIWPELGEQISEKSSAICIHWVHSPTRLRRCGVDITPITQANEEWKCGEWTRRARFGKKLRSYSTWLKFHRGKLPIRADRPDMTFTTRP